MSTMYVVDGSGSRPVCRVCRRKVGPAGRKRWTCIDCEILVARRQKRWADVGVLKILKWQEEQIKEQNRSGAEYLAALMADYRRKYAV